MYEKAQTADSGLGRLCAVQLWGDATVCRQWQIKQDDFKDNRRFPCKLCVPKYACGVVPRTPFDRHTCKAAEPLMARLHLTVAEDPLFD